MQISKLIFTGAALDLTGKGSLQLAGEQRLGTDLELELPRLAAASGLAGQPLSGSLAANVKASGSMTEPNVVLATHIDRLKTAGLDFPEITLDANAGGPIDRLTGRVRLAAREVRGSITLASDYARHGRKLDIRNLSLTAPETRLDGEAGLDLATQLANGRMNERIGDLGALAPFIGQELQGTVDLALELDKDETVIASGDLAALRLTATVDGSQGVEPFDLAARLQADVAGETAPPAKLALRAGVGGGRLDASAELGGLTDDPLRLQAALPLRIGLEPFAFELPRDRPIQGTLTGRTDLARIAQTFVLDGQRLQGLLTIDARLAGTLDRPLADGSIEIADGLVEDSISGVLLRDLTLRIVGDQSRINLATLSARDRRDGTLNGSGSLELGGASLTGLRTGLELTNLQIYNAEFGKAWLSGNVDVSGRLPNPPPGKPPTLPVSVAGAPPTPPPSASSGPALRIGLDVKVDMPEKFYVRGRGLESEWHGNISATGTADDPLVVGSINFRRGFLTLLDRRFSIDQGAITFSGAKPPLPELDIEARAKTSGGFTGIVQITGPAAKPKVELSSDPAAPQDEVISRIMFNRSSNEISPFQGLRLAAAIQQLQSGGDGLIGIGREALAVDTFDVSGGGEADTTASAGKYISDNVFFEVQQGITSGSGKAKLEIELTPSISVQTQVGQQGQTGASLNWTHDY